MKFTEYAATYTALRRRRTRQLKWTEVAAAYDAGLCHGLYLSPEVRHQTARVMRVLIAANKEVTKS